ncbi:hypothetical protein TDB9533_00947 [Thalassocella blandensis]|nr:hypothetical protein TDB9533_00947 [Thalassocella blandensis]
MSLKYLISFIVALVLSVPVLAEEDELQFGVIDGYTLGEPKILISDKVRAISPSMKVYSSNKSLVGRANLKQGQKVLYKSYRRKSDRRDVIEEIHILPPGT